MKAKTVAGAAAVVILAGCLGCVVYLRSGGYDAPEMPQASASASVFAPAPSQKPAPSPSPEPTPLPLPSPTPEPEPYADRPEIDISSWEYVIANYDTVLDASFSPELTGLEGGHYFDSRAVDALKAFIAAAREEGLSVILTSSYRSYATQQYLFNNKVAQYGGDEAVAASIVARPGTSEHQTGLSVDIVDRYYEYMNESLAETALSKWLAGNCAEYGFILRYPKDKQDVTKIMFEPWHFRYVGEEAARYIMENNLCLEEFLALYE